MKSNTLKKFVALRDGLLREKAGLEVRLAEINKALGLFPAVESVAPARRGRPRKDAAPKAAKPAKAPKARGRRKRAVNQASLKDTVIAVLKEKKSLPRKELLKAVIDGGYVFTASDPLNSLSTLIYSNRKIFNAKDGVISLA